MAVAVGEQSCPSAVHSVSLHLQRRLHADEASRGLAGDRPTDGHWFWQKNVAAWAMLRKAWVSPKPVLRLLCTNAGRDGVNINVYYDKKKNTAQEKNHARSNSCFFLREMEANASILTDRQRRLDTRLIAFQILRLLNTADKL